MEGKFISGMAIGLMVGAAAEMVAMPYMDQKSMRRMRKKVKMAKGKATHMYNSMAHMMK